MKIISISGTKSFKIENDDDLKVQLNYESSFSGKAIANLDKIEIEIVQKNFWNTCFEIIHNKEIVGDITFNWMSNAIISIDNNSFLFKHVDFFGTKFELLDSKENRLFLIKPNLNWKKLNYNYEAEIVPSSFDSKKLTELLLYIGFVANLRMTKGV